MKHNSLVMQGLSSHLNIKKLDKHMFFQKFIECIKPTNLSYAFFSST